ncbi:N-formylglutamate amidohydrolase [Hyphomonas johnsonii]|uniref:Putative N-formylglutamate amidohydrolase n=1 Tax=Hyphomonas johnsonii MHS-2 TaxID=1280950 RepID=A0A059FHH3_9PROT|nr:N-formylglutamate amidohydrolase [Hyphomonas johnsonii]KCZ90037.1 putative N-formylglutamate amidohydrolase [Hyphomonas johnsonii MHS-2]
MTGATPITQRDRPEPVGATVFDVPYTLVRPAKAAAPVLFASPHSGNVYPDAMKAALCVPLIDVRRTEDAFVDELFSDAPQLGAVLMAARYGRCVADLNRDPRELDAGMFSDGAPRPCGLPTARVDAGLGCLPRVAARGEAIYARRLTRAEGEARLARVHDAYHDQLGQELGVMRDLHRHALLIDCHSMPSVQPGRRHLADIVLGDRFGSSCDPRLTGRVERAFRAQGLSVARNAPYAGGYTTRRYGRPKRGVHALQIEINRGLYMDEHAIAPSDRFDSIRAIVADVTAEILAVARLLSPA